MLLSGPEQLEEHDPATGELISYWPPGIAPLPTLEDLIEWDYPHNEREAQRGAQLAAAELHHDLDED